MDYVRQKAKLLARMKMASGSKPAARTQVN
jgi:hypothetical protein